MSNKVKKTSIFTRMLINEKVALDFKFVNSLLTENLLEYLKKKFEGKCCEQGYIKQDSITIINYSSGIVKNNRIIFDVVFESLVCNLVEGMELTCIAKNITKAGIRAEFDMENTPAIIFIARDHHYINKMFNDVQEGNTITVKIIGQRFELNDTNISVIAELIKINKTSKKLLIEEDETILKSSEKILSDKKVVSESLEQKDDVTDINKETINDSTNVPLDKEAVDKQTIEKNDEDLEALKALDILDKKATDDKVTDDKATDDKEVLEEKKEINDNLNVEVEPVQEPVKEPVQEPVKEPVKEPVQEPVQEEDEDLEALKALEALELMDKEVTKDKNITIVPDEQVVKRKRGRPKKIK